VGLLWGGHAASVSSGRSSRRSVLKKFRRRAGAAVQEQQLEPGALAGVEELAGKIDYAFIGVGA